MTHRVMSRFTIVVCALAFASTAISAQMIQDPGDPIETTVARTGVGVPIGVSAYGLVGNRILEEPFTISANYDSLLGAVYGGRAALDVASVPVVPISPSILAGGSVQVPVPLGDTYLRMASYEIALGASAHIPLGGYISARVRGYGGMFQAFLRATASVDNSPVDSAPTRLPDSSAFGVYAEGSVELGVALAPPLDLVAGVSYSRYFGVEDFASAFVGLRWLTPSGQEAYHRGRDIGLLGRERGAPPGPHLQLVQYNIGPVFPVLFRYYTSTPFGSATVQNTSDYDLSSVQLRFRSAQHASTDRVIAEIDELVAGATIEVPISLLFEDTVLSITEGTEIAGSVIASYVVDGFEADFDAGVVMPFLDRNSIQWDDDNKVATFVTAKDDEVQRFAKTVAGVVRSERSPVLTHNFQTAMAMFESMRSHGMAYVVDPASAYASLSQDAFSVDYVQFPRQTLQFRAGDCDDLSVTFNALLEAVGIETAFVTIPGHIFAAARLEFQQDELPQMFGSPGDLIVLEDGSVWLPVEVTALDRGFREAWAIGATQWREHSPRDEAGFYRTRTAWETYAPVGFSVGRGGVDDVLTGDVRDSYVSELGLVARREVASVMSQLERSLQRRPDNPRTLNRMGVLYARYGLTSDAREVLEPLARGQSPYVPAVVNLANIELLDRQAEVAIDYFATALQFDPDNAAALAGTVQAAHALGEFISLEDAYQQLEQVDAELAGNLSHLAGRSDTRAREYGEFLLRWEDEE